MQMNLPRDDHVRQNGTQERKMTMPPEKLAAIDATYGSHALIDRLLQNLETIGKDLDVLTTADLIAFDELHIMGRKATIDLGRLAGFDETMHVLDIGSGVGGPARTLAEAFGCRVTGVDLSTEFVNAATVLTERVGLAGLVDFRTGDALNLPYADGCFDASVLIHLNMNIDDKAAMFSEALRVLKPGGKLALWELCRGNMDGGLFYPVPWAEDESFSHLVAVEAMVALLESCGGVDLVVQDATDAAIEWVTALQQKVAARSGPRPVRPNLDLVLKNFRLKRINISKNLMQGRIRILRALAVAGSR